MNLLLIAPSYPHTATEWVGAQNERAALELCRIVKDLVVLAPRPYAPKLLAFHRRWRMYASMPKYDVRNGVRVYRPAYPVLPFLLRGYWDNPVSFLFSRRIVAALDRRTCFDAILSFDLASTGALAWQLGAFLDIPACGWATGSDIRADEMTRVGRNVKTAMRRLDLVFYQSDELKAIGAQLLGARPEALCPERHVVQSRGVKEPETLPGDAARRSIRSRLRLSDHDVIVLYLGRIVRGKGLFELVDAFATFAKTQANLVLLLVGAIPGHDDTSELRQKISALSGVQDRIRIVSACPPDRIWDYFKAADIFAFPSFREGMPNSLLEAMLAGLPAVAFSIPAVREITAFGKGLTAVDAYDFSLFGAAVLDLATNHGMRRDRGEQGQTIVREHFSLSRNMCRVVDRIQRLTIR
jgi:teichuronic acid biosynthesis glycosyltransferase TuaC